MSVLQEVENYNELGYAWCRLLQLIIERIGI